MRPYIAKNVCNHCGECVTICPYDVFFNEDGSVSVCLPDDCIECRACTDACPQKAICMDD